MFFPTRIKSINKNDRVLEVGPGNNPFYRSDVLLEKKYEDEETAYKQAGSVEKKTIKKEIVYYDGGAFPFKDKEFDYVICSHVLEHIPVSELELFISELTRVAYKGYVEFPLYRFELIADIEQHVNLINIDENNKIYFFDKKRIDFSCESYNCLQNIIKESLVAHKLTSLNPERLCFGFEFFNTIEYKVVEELNHITLLNSSKDPYLSTNYNIAYLMYKIIRQFNKNIFLQKLYNKFSLMKK